MHQVWFILKISNQSMLTTRGHSGNKNVVLSPTMACLGSDVMHFSVEITQLYHNWISYLICGSWIQFYSTMQFLNFQAVFNFKFPKIDFKEIHSVFHPKDRIIPHTAAYFWSCGSFICHCGPKPCINNSVARVSHWYRHTFFWTHNVVQSWRSVGLRLSGGINLFCPGSSFLLESNPVLQHIIINTHTCR